jgi:hypothetical protein
MKLIFKNPFFNHSAKVCVISLICITTFIACKSNKKSVIEFNDKIITEQEALIKAESTLINSLNGLEKDSIEKDYQMLLSQIVTSENKINGLTDPDPEIGFKKAALKLFSVYKDQTQNGYKTLVDLSFVPDSLYTPKQAKKFEEVSSSVFVTLNAEVDSFISVQKKLAEKYKFSFKK